MAIKKSNHLLPSDVWIVAYNLNSHIDAVKDKPKIKKRAYYGSWEEHKAEIEEWQRKVQLANKAKEIRHGYIKTLRNLGWTLESIGEAFGVTRERVRQLATIDCPALDPNINLPFPTPPERPERIRVVRPMPDEETLARLKELHDKAKLVRYNQPTYRKEAEEFTYLLNHLVNVEKFPMYRIAKFLGVTNPAISARLVRYGYKTTTGNSRCFTTTKHRVSLH
jgi:predicted XRE-type DNA-binding protein